MKQFVHLHLHTEYSLLDGAAKISKLYDACKTHNMPAIAITDHGNLFGAFRFFKTISKANKQAAEQAKEQGIEPFIVKPIIGCEMYCCFDTNVRKGQADTGHLVLLCKNETGYKNLIKLVSFGYLEGFYYKPRIDYKLLAKHGEGLICLSGCLGGHIQEYLTKNMYDEAKKVATDLINIFGKDDFYIELQSHGFPEQERILPNQVKLAKELGIKTVISNDVHYVIQDEAQMQDIMLCVQTGAKQDDENRMKMGSDQFFIKNYEQMEKAFAQTSLKKEEIETALNNTLEIASKCNFKMQTGLPLMPAFDDTGISSEELLKKLTRENAPNVYPNLTQEIKDRIEYELDILCKLKYADYYLIVRDFVKKAEENDIPVGPGRGSVAGSIVAYINGITKVCPLEYGLYFERFLNPERVSPPDIDLDFCFNRRGEVIDYVVKKYGADKVCQIITFNVMQAKAAIKDVARVLDVPAATANQITKAMGNVATVGKDPIRKIFGGVDIKLDKENEKYTVPELKEMFENDPLINKVVRFAVRLEGMPRHTGVHAAGVVICKDPIQQHIPQSKNRDDVTTQYDWREVEETGMLKMDFLGLKTLTDIKATTDMVQKIYGKKIDFYSKDFSYSDPAVFKIITSGNTDAVFQLESSGMKKLMKELKPDNMEDLLAAIALYRPGPMGSIPQFVANKHNPDKITYEHPLLEPILKSSYGIIVYQEQVMQIFRDLAGYSLAQADWVRKVMGKKLLDELPKEKKKFIDGDKKLGIVGCVNNGVSREVAEQLFKKMETFAEYAFNKSHSAVYAYIAYQTAFLKKDYETEFVASVMNNRITKVEEVSVYMRYAKRVGIQILPPSVNKSGKYFEPTGKDSRAIRFGLMALKNVGEGVVEELIKVREKVGGFKDIGQLIDNLDGQCLNKKFIEALIYSGALDEFGVSRSKMVAVFPELVERSALLKKHTNTNQISLFGEEFSEKLGENNKAQTISYPNVPEYKKSVKLKFEKEAVGVYLSEHPLDEFADKFEEYNFFADMIKQETEEDESAEKIEDADGLKDGMPVTCGGIIAHIKRLNTKKTAQEMAIVQVEDTTGSYEVMVFPKIFERVKRKLVVDAMLTIHGKISVRTDEAPIVLAEKMEFWHDGQVKDENELEEVQEQEKAKTLFLKYSTLDKMLQDQLVQILNSHQGQDKVKVRCSETNQAKTMDITVNITDTLLIELKGILPPENIAVR